MQHSIFTNFFIFFVDQKYYFYCRSSTVTVLVWQFRDCFQMSPTALQSCTSATISFLSLSGIPGRRVSNGPKFAQCQCLFLVPPLKTSQCQCYILVLQALSTKSTNFSALALFLVPLVLLVPKLFLFRKMIRYFNIKPFQLITEVTNCLQGTICSEF